MAHEANTDEALLAKINAAVAEHNAAEQAVTTAQSELVSKSKVVGQLLLEAKKLHPKVAEFEAFLKRVKGLKLSRAYDLLRLVGGRTTDEELRKDARERKQKSRAKKKLPKPAATPDTKPPLSVTDPMSRNLQATAAEDGERATGSADTEFTEEQHRARMAALSVPADLSVPPFLDRTNDGAEQKPAHRNYQSAHCRDKFIEACRIYLPKITEDEDRTSVYDAWTLAMEDWARRFGKKARRRDMADRNSIIDKIKALLSKTTANGATEAEMLAALDKAAAMRDAYDITDAELQIAKDEAVMLHADPPDLQDPHKIKWRLAYAVRQFCGVQIYRSPGEGGFHCIGMPSDVQFAMWLLDNLADFVFNALMEHLIGCLAPKSERRIITRSFTEACCSRISDRMLELVERSKKARTSNGRELVVVKDAAIKAFMREHGIHLRTCCMGSSSNIDSAAQAAGRAAGDRASFGRPVSGAAGVLRIGRA